MPCFPPSPHCSKAAERLSDLHEVPRLGRSRGVRTQASPPAPRAVFFLLHHPAPGRKTASGKQVWQWKGRNDGRGGRRELEPCGGCGGWGRYGDGRAGTPGSLVGRSWDQPSPLRQAWGCRLLVLLHQDPREPEIKYSFSPAQATLLPLTANVLL